MMVRLEVTALLFSLLCSAVYGGSPRAGAYSSSGLLIGDYPFVDNNYTLFRSGSTLVSRQVQGCQSDPTSVQCGNSTTCCSSDYPTCCLNQDWCCQSGYHCCPKQTCCLNSDNCLTPGYCCPKTAQTCGQPDFCLSDDQSCCDGSPDGYCDAGFTCTRTSNGTAACCKSGQHACSGGYCCDEGFTCSGGGMCQPPSSSSATPSSTQPPQQSSPGQSSTGSAASASSTPGDGGIRLIETSLGPLASLVLLLIPFGLFL